MIKGFYIPYITCFQKAQGSLIHQFHLTIGLEAEQPHPNVLDYGLQVAVLLLFFGPGCRNASNTS